MKDPKTYAEWQVAVDAAAGFIAIDDCRLYGLITGGPTVDRNRSLDILEKGKARGIRPSRPDQEIAIGIIKEWNRQRT